MYINYRYADPDKTLSVTVEPLYPVSKNALMFIRDSAGFGSGTARMPVCSEAIELLKEPGMNRIRKFLGETGFPSLDDHYLIEFFKTIEQLDY